jgi:hypothetical protein
MIDTLHRAGIEVILCSPTQAFLGVNKDYISTYAKSCKVISTQKNVFFIDMFEEFNKFILAGNQPFNIVGDDTHLVASDYHILADIILANCLIPSTPINAKTKELIPAVSNSVFTNVSNKYKNTLVPTGAALILDKTVTGKFIRVGLYCTSR